MQVTGALPILSVTSRNAAYVSSEVEAVRTISTRFIARKTMLVSWNATRDKVSTRNRVEEM